MAAACVTTVIALALPSAAFATKDLDLLTAANVELSGEASNDQAGRSVANAGDFNHDGILDVIIGAPRADRPGKTDAGKAYLIYGQLFPTAVDLAQIHTGGTQDSRGMEIDGGAAGDLAGSTVDGIIDSPARGVKPATSDFNGDGIDDVIVGARGVSSNRGAAYIIYGENTADPADVDLLQVPSGTQSSRGLQILGITGGFTGLASHAVGDINGDQRRDVAVEAVTAGFNGANSGAVWVIYGSNNPDASNIDLTNVVQAGSDDNRGFRIIGAAGGDFFGSATGVVGDVPYSQDMNFDGIDDLIATATTAAGSKGVAYVIYGLSASDPSDVNLATDTARFFRITGPPNVAANAPTLGTSVAGLGDQNNDDRGDLLVGAPGADAAGRNDSGKAYVIYSDPGIAGDIQDVDLANITTTESTRGFQITGEATSDQLGGVGSAAVGDMNGDDTSDFFVNAIFADPSGRTNAGTAYAIYNTGNSSDPPDLDLAQLRSGAADPRGFAIDGAQTEDRLGSAVAPLLDDLDQDGIANVLIGAREDPAVSPGTGRAYIVEPVPPVVTVSPPAGIDFGSKNVGAPLGASAVATLHNTDPEMIVSSFGATLQGTDPGDFVTSNDNCFGVYLLPDPSPASSCTTSVQFDPQSTGSRSADLRFNVETAGFWAIPLSGVGLDPGAALTPTSRSFGNQNIGTTSSSQTIQISNPGSDPLTISSIVKAGSDPGEFTLDTHSCVGTLNPAATCDVDVAFAPGTRGAKSALIRFNDDANNTPQDATVTGTGVDRVAAAGSPLSFTTQQANTLSAPQPAQITNNGQDPFTVSTVALAGTNPGQFQLSNDTCTGQSVAASGGTCTVDVRFAPTSSGNKSAVVRYTDDAPGSPHDQPLSGVAVDRTADLSPTSVPLPDTNVGTQSGPSTVRVTNNGTDSLTISNIALAGTDPGEFVLDPHSCIGVLVAGDHCDVDVAIHPTTRGTKNAVVRFTDDANNSPQDATLSGLALDPGISIPPQVTFPARNVGTVSPAQTVTATNSGQDPLNISSIQLTGGNAAEFSTSNDTCTGASLNPAQTCTVDVTFAPTTRGPKASTLRFHDNVNGNLHDVQLVGAGETPALTVTPHDGLDFGLVEFTTQSDPQSLAVENTGPDPITLSAVSITGADAADFAKGADSCQGQTLTPSQACAVQVRFTPGTVGTKSASLQVDSNAIGGPTVVPLAGIGQENVPPPIAGNRGVGAVESGTVLIKKPTDPDFNRVEAGSVVRIPVNTVVDATNGEIAVVSEKDHKTGATRVGHFSQGVFRFFQRDVRRPITEIILAGGGSCPVTAGKPKGRKIFGNAGGGHRTSGAYGAATVRGTQWLTEDVCGPDGELLGTRISTVEGKVEVSNFRNKKTKIVKAGRSVLIAATP